MFRACCYTAHRGIFVTRRFHLPVQPLCTYRYQAAVVNTPRYLGFHHSSKMASTSTSTEEVHTSKPAAPHGASIEEVTEVEDSSPQATSQVDEAVPPAPRGTSFLAREPEPDATPASAPHAPLPLPAPSDASSPAPENRSTTVEVNGQAVALDHLGPTVIGRDGTLGRIANWPEMTPWERENTLRVLGKRNQLRLAGLRAEKEKEGNNGKAEGESS